MSRSTKSTLSGHKPTQTRYQQGDDSLWQLEDDPNLPKFISFAALDMIDTVCFASTSCFLGTVDQYGEWLVSAYLSVSGERFLLMHDGKIDDGSSSSGSMSGLKGFFAEMHECWVRMIMMNPFYLRPRLSTPSMAQHADRPLGLVDSVMRMDDYKQRCPQSMNAFDLKVRVLAKKYGLS